MDTPKRPDDWFFAINNPDEPSKFQEAFNESAERIGRETMETRHDGIKVIVRELRPGDLFYLPELGYYIFVCKGEHPIWPQFQAVIWCNAQGELTIDALSPQQQLHGVVVNRGEAPNERALRFRRWYLERKK